MTTDPTSSPATPIDMLDAAADAVRAFNHATAKTGPGWQTPADTYDALGALADIAHRLTQAITQATSPTSHALRDDRLRAAAGIDPDSIARQAIASLDNAIIHATRLTTALRIGHSLTATLGATETAPAEPTAKERPHDSGACRRCGQGGQ